MAQNGNIPTARASPNKGCPDFGSWAAGEDTMNTKKLMDFIDVGKYYYAIALLILVVLFIIHEYTYVPPEQTYVTILTVPISTVIFNFVILSICAAWIIHGFGFIIIRR